MSKLYYAETGLGACIRAASNIDIAEQKITKEVGTFFGVQSIREATLEDIEHVKAMGGRVPEIS
jgi:hypothetical protein